MKIALTSLYLPSGSKIGVGYQVHGLANALCERGHEVTVFSPCEKPEGACYDVEMVRPGKSLRTFGFAWDLRKINFERFDVLNAHGDDWFLWGIPRPRHVHTFHGSCLAEMMNICGLKEKLRMGMLAAFEAQTVLLADETVAVSENTRRYVAGIRRVIPCGVNLDSFSPGTSKSERPSILFVGTMHGRKRGRMLLDKFQNEVRKSVPEAELWCVCDRPEGMSEMLGTRWFGRIAEAELTELYRTAWVFCLPSSYEGFGVPYIEAMASGAPVIATVNPGSVEVTGNGKYGILTSEADLGGRLGNLLLDAKARREYERLGLERCKDFSWDTVCSQYERLYAGEENVKVIN